MGKNKQNGPKQTKYLEIICPKNESGWANFNARLDTEDLNVIIPSDHTEITDLVTWLIS